MAEIIDIQIHPTLGNLNDVVRQIQSRLSSIHAPVRVTVDDSGIKSLSGLDNKIRGIRREFDLMTDATTGAAVSMQKFGEQSALAIKRFSAFTVVTSGFIGLTNAIVQSTRSAIAFNKEMVRISQVTGQPVSQLGDLRQEIERLSTGLGVSSTKLLNSAQVLAQAGLSAEDVRVSLEALAKSDLSPTFDDITQTTEGAIAIFSQFKIEAEELEATLGSINAVSAKFAVESGDIITAVRRTGGAFAAAGGSLNELIALFTSVRATTRESAETISTGFRTIFTRLQRTSTQNALSTLGIQLQDLEGQFVGPYEAIRRISAALSELRSTDPRFSQVVEELGGFRQVSKVIPLIQEFGTAQRALAVAQAGQTSLSEDAVTAQQSLANQIAKTKEQFAALIRTVAESDTFKASVDVVLRLAQAFIKLGEALTPLLQGIPLLAALGAFKFGTNIKAFAQGFGPAIKPGGVSKFATGGLVPGVGNRDTVPAYLTPGEFVVRKDAVEAIGVDNLQKFNQGGMVAVQRFAGGSKVNKITVSASKAGAAKGAGLFATEGLKSFDDKFETQDIAAIFLNPGQDSKDFVRNVSIEVPEINKLFTGKKRPGAQLPEFQKELPSGKTTQKKLGIRVHAGTIDGEISKNIQETTKANMVSAINTSAELIGQQLGLPVNKFTNPERVAKFNVESVAGNIFEGALNAVGAPFKPEGSSQDTFDFPKGIGSTLAPKFFDKGPVGIESFPADAKSTFGPDSLGSLTKKVKNLYVEKAKQLTQASNVTAGAKPSPAANVATLLQSFSRDDVPVSKSGAVDIAEFRRKIYNVGSEGGPDRLPKVNQDELSVINQFLKDNQFNEGKGIRGESVFKKFADGGPIYAEKKGNKVPVLLTPGEFVFDKQTADRIGSAKLNSLNKGIVPGTGNTDTVAANLEVGQYVLNKKSTQKLRTGGYVGVQKFQAGGSAGFGASGLVGLAAVGTFANTFTDADSELNKLVSTVTGSVAQFSLLSSISLELANSFKQLKEARQKSVTEAEENLKLKTKEESDIASELNRAKTNKTQIEKQDIPQADIRFFKARDALEKQRASAGFTTGTQAEAEFKAAKENLKQLRSSLRETSESIKSLDKNLQAAKVSSQEAANRVTALNKTFGQKIKETFEGQKGVLAIAGAGAAGSFLTDRANKRIAAGENADIQAGFGGAASTAANFASIGLAFGPKGAIIGGLIGGVVGFVNASKEAAEQLRFNTAKKEIDALGKTLERVNKGQLTTFGSSGVIARQLESGVSSLFTTADAEKRKSLESQLAGNVPAVEQFLASLAKSSRTIDDFRKSAGTTIRSLSLLSGIPIAELNSSYEKQINLQNKQAELTRLMNAEFDKLNSQARRLSDVFSAVSTAKLSVETNDLSIKIPQLEAFASGRIGESRQPDTAGILGSEKPVLDVGLFESALNRFTANIGNKEISSSIVGELRQANLAKQAIPDILSAVQARGFFEGDASGLVTRAEDSLRGTKLSEDAKNTILTGLKNEIGTEPAKFLDKLQASRRLVEQELLKNLQYSAEEAGRIAAIMTEQANKLSSGLDRARQTEFAVREKLLRAIDLREQAASTRAEGRGTSLSTQERTVFDEQRLAEILKGTGLTSATPEQLLEKLIQAQKEVLTLEQEPPEERGRAGFEQKLQEQKTVIDAVTKALEFFGDATARNAKFQDELSKRRQTRDALRGFGETATFGSATDKLALSRSLAGAIALSRTNDIRTIAPELRGGILNVLKQLGSTPLKGLGGRSGKDVIEATIRNDAIAQLGPKLGNEIADAIISGAEEEKRLQEAVVANLNSAATSMKGLADVQRDNNKSFIESLNANFNLFFKKMDENLLKTEQQKLKGEETALTETQTGLKNQAAKIVNLNKLLNTVNVSPVSTFRESGFAQDEKRQAAATAQLKSLQGGIDILQQLKTAQEEAGVLEQLSQLRKSLDLTTRTDTRGRRRVDFAAQQQVLEQSELFKGFDFSVPFSVSNIAKIISSTLETKAGGLLGNTPETKSFLAQRVRELETTAKISQESARAVFLSDIRRKLINQLSTTQLDRDVKVADLTKQTQSVFGENVKIDELIKVIPEFETILKSLTNTQGQFVVPLQEKFDDNKKALEDNSLASQNNTTALKNLEVVVRNLEQKQSQVGKGTVLAPESPSFKDLAGYAVGGRVPGKGTRDTVPALLTPGELVIPKGVAESRDTDKLLGFAGRYGFADGGSTAELLQAIKRRRQLELEAAQKRVVDTGLLPAVKSRTEMQDRFNRGFEDDLSAATGVPKADTGELSQITLDNARRLGLDKSPEQIATDFRNKAPALAKQNLQRREILQINPLAAGRGFNLGNTNVSIKPFTKTRADILQEQTRSVDTPTKTTNVGKVTFQNKALSFASGIRKPTPIELQIANSKSGDITDLADAILANKGIKGDLATFPEIRQAAIDRAIQLRGFEQQNVIREAGFASGRNIKTGKTITTNFVSKRGELPQQRLVDEQQASLTQFGGFSSQRLLDKFNKVRANKEAADAQVAPNQANAFFQQTTQSKKSPTQTAISAAQQDLFDRIRRRGQYAPIANPLRRVEGGIIPALVAGGEMVFSPNSLPMNKLNQANNGQRMLTGGELSKGQIVHSASSGDSVPIDLPVGAFVLRASQVERSVNNATRTRFASGGEVGKHRYQTGGNVSSGNVTNLNFRPFTQAVDEFGGYIKDMSKELSDFNKDFNAALNQFSQLTSSLQKLDIPTEITLTAQHTVTVIHNGAEIFSALTPEFEKYAQGVVQKAFKQFTDKNFEGRFAPLDL